MCKKIEGQPPRGEAADPGFDKGLVELYVKLFRRMNPDVPGDLSDKDCIRLFRKWVRRMFVLFKILDKPLFSNLAYISRACMFFAITDTNPRGEREGTYNAWSEWLSFVMYISRQKSLTTQNMQRFRKLERDLDKLREAMLKDGGQSGTETDIAENQEK